MINIFFFRIFIFDRFELMMIIKKIYMIQISDESKQKKLHDDFEKKIRSKFYQKNSNQNENEVYHSKKMSEKI